jgi:hypothetical protein
MKALTAVLCLSAVATGALAQGIINFANTPSTLISAKDPVTGNIASMYGAPGSFYFGLLVATPGTTDPTAFTFTGNYATNSGVAPGRFVLNGAQVPANFWGPGVTKSYEIAGWSGNLGVTFNPAWLTEWFAGTGPGGLFALSAIGTGAAGGTDASGHSIPPFPLFGGTGITQGFNFFVPEPSSMTLACLSAAALLLFRRWK